MKKDVKIVIGANYGDEGKGMMTRYFALEAKRQNKNPIVVLHNGSAQHGHTVDYGPGRRHVFHHFGSGTGDGIPTYLAETFWVHPMEFARERVEVLEMGINPLVFCDYSAPVITPFDMLVDHATEAWIALQRGEREYASCGYGTWCALEGRAVDAPSRVYTVDDYARIFTERLPSDYTKRIRLLLEQTWKDCLYQLVKRGVDITQLPDYADYFTPNSPKKEGLISHFLIDLKIFFDNITLTNFNKIITNFTPIFETSQGLGLDMNVDSDWHTTSNTGLANPVKILTPSLAGLVNNVEVCYVSRSYITRHGIGPMGNETAKKTINEDMTDKTNVHNEFQGTLRYGYPEEKEMMARIDKDFAAVAKDRRFTKAIAITHCNEFPNEIKEATYESYNPYSVLKN